MKAKIKVEKEVEIRFLQVRAGVRYWEDATVNGVEDTEGDLIPCRDGDNWKPIINVDEGRITNWDKGTTANIHYKVCDDGDYSLCDEGLNELIVKDGYVPKIMCPKGSGYGDYIIMDIDADGYIQNWNPDLNYFINDDDDDC